MSGAGSSFDSGNCPKGPFHYEHLKLTFTRCSWGELKSRVPECTHCRPALLSGSISSCVAWSRKSLLNLCEFTDPERQTVCPPGLSRLAGPVVCRCPELSEENHGREPHRCRWEEMLKPELSGPGSFIWAAGLSWLICVVRLSPPHETEVNRGGASVSVPQVS